MIKQLNLFEMALPEIWAVGVAPKLDGIYKCRVKLNNGDILFKDIECKNNIFLLDEGRVLAWR